jgi:predicted amino acid dehydrogenase
MPTSPEREQQVVAAVESITAHTTAATHRQVVQELRDQGVELAEAEIAQTLFDLGHSGVLQVVDAAPSPDGLPTQGYYVLHAD